jgi:hypothetical protein
MPGHINHGIGLEYVANAFYSTVLRQQSSLGSENPFVGALQGRSISDERDLRDAQASLGRHHLANAPQERPYRPIVPLLMDHESLMSAFRRRAEQANGERSTDASTLPCIGHDESHLRTVIVASYHVAERDDVVAIARVQFRDERQSP